MRWGGSWQINEFSLDPVWKNEFPAHQVMYTVKEYMQTVTAVDPYWLAELVA